MVLVYDIMQSLTSGLCLLKICNLCTLRSCYVFRSTYSTMWYCVCGSRDSGVFGNSTLELNRLKLQITDAFEFQQLVFFLWDPSQDLNFSTLLCYAIFFQCKFWYDLSLYVTFSLKDSCRSMFLYKIDHNNDYSNH